MQLNNICPIYSWKKLKLRKIAYISQYHTLLKWFTLELHQGPLGIAIPCSMDHANLPPFINILTDGGNAGLELAIWSNLLIVQMRPWEVRWFMQQVSGDVQTKPHTQYVLSPVKVLRTMMSVPSYQSYHRTPHTSRPLCVLFYYTDDSCAWGVFFSDRTRRTSEACGDLIKVQILI